MRSSLMVRYPAEPSLPRLPPINPNIPGGGPWVPNLIAMLGIPVIADTATGYCNILYYNKLL